VDEHRVGERGVDGLGEGERAGALRQAAVEGGGAGRRVAVGAGLAGGLGRPWPPAPTAFAPFTSRPFIA
jgi:hypothetical protein